ncbi:MAG: bifunctional hydroxymethylpyrimidine kinase/phosphomethylpyrimidine kinase [Chthoniobacterales bacterium]
MPATSEVRVALTIAGSDSSAGAGAQADLKTFSAYGVYGVNAITSVVAEMPGKVSQIHGLPPSIVREQIEVLFGGFRIYAVKTGLLYSAEISAAVAEALGALNTKSQRPIPLVIDPVMVATSGDLLLEDEAVAVYETQLFPLAALVTPNLDEAARLLGEPITTLRQMRSAGEALHVRHEVPFLLKGGHLRGATATDFLFIGDRTVEFSQPFIRGVATHGTGCTYSAAITAGLALGLSLEEAVGRAKGFVTRSIEQHFTWRSGSGTAIHALNHPPSQPGT